MTSTETSLSAKDKFLRLSFLRSICLEHNSHLFPRFSYCNMFLNGKWFRYLLCLAKRMSEISYIPINEFSFFICRRFFHKRELATFGENVVGISKRGKLLRVKAGNWNVIVTGLNISLSIYLFQINITFYIEKRKTRSQYSLQRDYWNQSSNDGVCDIFGQRHSIAK